MLKPPPPLGVQLITGYQCCMFTVRVVTLLTFCLHIPWQWPFAGHLMSAHSVKGD